MGQTKRKRRTKHRGNAVGVFEARGRTSKPAATAAKGGSRANGRGTAGRPAIKEPTLKGAMLKALMGIVILFVFFRFVGNGTSTGQALAMCTVAFVLYTPLMFFTDKWIYNRKLRAPTGGTGSRR